MCELLSFSEHPVQKMKLRSGELKYCIQSHLVRKWLRPMEDWKDTKKFTHVTSCHSHQNHAFDVYKLIEKKRLTHTNSVYS